MVKGKGRLSVNHGRSLTGEMLNIPEVSKLEGTRERKPKYNKRKRKQKPNNTEYLPLSDTSKSQKFYEIATSIICILQMRKFRYRKIK